MNHYASGKYKENKVREQLEGLGYFVVRSSLSRGPADLVALKAGKVPMLVQVKSGGLGLRPIERTALVEAAQQAGGAAVLALYARGGVITLFRYTGPAAGDREPLTL